MDRFTGTPKPQTLNPKAQTHPKAGSRWMPLLQSHGHGLETARRRRWTCSDIVSQNNGADGSMCVVIAGILMMSSSSM